MTPKTVRKESSCGILDGKGEQLEALERVCDKRYIRASKAGYSDMEANRAVVKHLDEYIGRWSKSEKVKHWAEVLRSYWIARQA